MSRERDQLARPVRHLHADRRLARDRGQDADVRRRHGVGDVLGQAGDPRHLHAGAELDLVAGHRRAHPAPDQTGLHAVRRQRPHQLRPRCVDLALVQAQLLRRRQHAHRGQDPFARGSGRGRDRRLAARHRLGLGLGVERDVDVGVVRLGRRRDVRVVVLHFGGRRDQRGRLRPVVGPALVGQHHEGLAAPQGAGPAAGGDRTGAQRAPDRGDRHAGGDEEGDQHDRDEEHGRTRRAEPRVQRPPDARAEIAAGVLQRVRVRERRRVLRQFEQPAHAEDGEDGADGQAPRVGAGGHVVAVAVVVAPGARAAVDEQRDARSGGDERQQEADPAGQQCEARVGAAADGAELAEPQGEGEQDAEGDQRHGPQVAGLDAPERRPRRRGRGAAGAGSRFLGGGARRRARGAPSAGLGHHSAAETTG